MNCAAMFYLVIFKSFFSTKNIQGSLHPVGIQVYMYFCFYLIFFLFSDLHKFWPSNELIFELKNPDF